MISNHHVIVDAGGTIYAGTFSDTAHGAQCSLFFKNNPGINEAGVDFMADWWKDRQVSGDRCVQCTIETHEVVSVTIQRHFT